MTYSSEMNVHMQRPCNQKKKKKVLILGLCGIQTFVPMQLHFIPTEAEEKSYSAT